jgi:hypothetical protein
MVVAPGGCLERVIPEGHKVCRLRCSAGEGLVGNVIVVRHEDSAAARGVPGGVTSSSLRAIFAASAVSRA